MENKKSDIDFKELMKPALILLAICVIAAILLAFVQKITAAPIQEQKDKAELLAMQEILPEATSFEDVQVEFTGDIYLAKAGYNNDAVVGYIVGVAPKGYSGSVYTLVAFDDNGTIKNIQITEHTETPGLGANATNPSFTSQYSEKVAPLEVTKTAPAKDNEIMAITSATITSKAVTKGVNEASDFFNANLKGGK